jgi:hypothetical protein
MVTIVSSTAIRQRLPNRRRCQTREIEFAGLRFKVSVGYFPDGSLAEAFISNHKAGNASDVAARDAGILLSLCLQHGCPIETISRAITRNSNGSAGGVIAAVLDAFSSEGGDQC